jgi:outer membrane protein OmpA-like peptidoglycan-associated protein
MRKPVFVVCLFALTLAVAPACATKKFVRQEVGQVNDKVGTLSKSLEETQERVRQTEGRVTEVDAKAAAAQNSANQAQQTATAANSNATAVGQRADARADSIEAATRKLLFEVVLNEDQGKFKFNNTELPTEATAAIDQMVSGIQSQKSAIWIEIEGHTDNVGDKRYNERLGLQRAEAVKKYLYEKHQVPLHKMNVISYGEDKPAAPNKTREGRSQNRRVVIKVLA